MHQTARRFAIAAALVLLAHGTAYAQLEKRFAVGVSVVNFEPAADELSSEMRVVPTISRVPRQGLGLALALNWYATDVNEFTFLDDRFAKLTVRPFMAGIGYTVMNGAFSITPSVVAGPAWNKLKVDDDVSDLFFVRKEDDGDFEQDATTITFVVRPGVSATYAITPRFGVTGFAGYVFNRPKFELTSAFNTGVSPIPSKADGLSLSVGIVVPIF
jgi:hypothetical protein